MRDWGGMDLVLVDCVFENNRQNWSLTYSAKGLVAIDCVYDEPQQGNVYRCWKHRDTGVMQYPSFTSRRHVVVRTVDDAGAPVSNAVVRVSGGRDDASLIDNHKTVTRADGRTPGRGQEGAILLTETTIKATDTPNQPEVAVYAYDIRAEAAGYEPAQVKAFTVSNSWETMTITLARQR